VLSSFAVGKELYEAQDPTARLRTSGVSVPRFFPQVIAESPGGDPNNIVLAGAHLDSVTSGPGINDDGSGTAWQLELGEQIPKLGTLPREKIRLMWFGGEEDGLVGSQYYAAHLSQAEIDLSNRAEPRVSRPLVWRWPRAAAGAGRRAERVDTATPASDDTRSCPDRTPCSLGAAGR